MGLARQKEQHPQSRQMGERPVGGSRTGTGRGGTVKAGGAWGRKRGWGYREEELGGGALPGIHFLTLVALRMKTDPS